MANLDPLTNGSYWGPIEPSKVLLVERILFSSGYVTTAFTTAQIIFYFICMRILWKECPRKPRQYLLMAYSTVLCITNLIVCVLADNNGVLAWIDNRNFPGGPLGYAAATSTLPSSFAGLTMLVLGNILADLLLLYRCRVVLAASWGYERTYQINLAMAIPVLTALAAFAMGIIFVVGSAVPGGNLTVKDAQFGLAYFSLSLALNLILTGMIIFRIWHHQRFIRKSLGIQEPRDAQEYNKITVMFAESAALYTIALIPLLVTFALNSTYSQIFLSIASATQMICSYNIIWRVAQNRAFSRDTVTCPGSSMVFAAGTKSGRSSSKRDSLEMGSKANGAVQLHKFVSDSGYGDAAERSRTDATASNPGASRPIS